MRIDGDIVGEIGAGLMILYCAEAGDGDDAVQRLAEKTAELRFADEAGKMNKASPISAAALVVRIHPRGQYRQGQSAKLYRRRRPGRRPPLRRLLRRHRGLGIPVATGRFGADMQVELINDGPVTIPVPGDVLADISVGSAPGTGTQAKPSALSSEQARRAETSLRPTRRAR